MRAKFSIFQAATQTERPPISYRVSEYFEHFVTEHILEKKKIIIQGEWDVHLTIYFLTNGPKVLFKGIALGKGVRTVISERVKLYSALILIEPIQSAENPFLKTIELMYDAIKLFFTTTFKKVTPEFIDELWSKVDLDYLLSLPYPAPLSQQKYVGDR